MELTLRVLLAPCRLQIATRTAHTLPEGAPLIKAAAFILMLPMAWPWIAQPVRQQHAALCALLCIVANAKGREQ
jgi:hypothetical protein